MIGRGLWYSRQLSFFKQHIFFIDLRERKGDTQKDRNFEDREISISCLLHAPLLVIELHLGHVP